jgi:EamA domain-containing membrane protein RarD
MRRTTRQFALPRPSRFLAILNGTFDVGANVFFILAGQSGRLDIAAILGSFYPGVTVLLARIILKERLSNAQWAGVVIAWVAILLIAV